MYRIAFIIAALAASALLAMTTAGLLLAHELLMALEIILAP